MVAAFQWKSHVFNRILVTINMKIIVALLAIFIAIFIWRAIAAAYWQRVRDKAAHAVLDNAADFSHEKAEILSINRVYGFASTKGTCPVCGGILLIRRGINGSFFDCSNYPQCTFVKRAS